MVQASVPAPTPGVIQPSPATSVAVSAVSAVSDASIAAYLAAGERMRIFAGWAIIAGILGMLLFVAALLLGVIPVRLF